MFRIAVSIFRIAECTFRSGERTFRSAEHKTKHYNDKITIALVNTLRQLLSHIHYYYPHIISLPYIHARAYAHQCFSFSFATFATKHVNFLIHNMLNGCKRVAEGVAEVAIESFFNYKILVF